MKKALAVTFAAMTMGLGGTASAIAADLAYPEATYQDQDDRNGVKIGYLNRIVGEFTLEKKAGDYRDIVFVGTGTGLAPLIGVTRAALAAGHRAAIHLYHGSTSVEGLYLWGELAQLAEAAPQLRVFGSVWPAPEAAQPRAATAPAARCRLLHQPLERLILDDPLDCFDCRVYLCGDPELVQRLRQRVYLCGAPLARIHCDPFVAPKDS